MGEKLDDEKFREYAVDHYEKHMKFALNLASLLDPAYNTEELYPIAFKIFDKTASPLIYLWREYREEHKKEIAQKIVDKEVDRFLDGTKPKVLTVEQQLLSHEWKGNKDGAGGHYAVVLADPKAEWGWGRIFDFSDEVLDKLEKTGVEVDGWMFEINGKRGDMVNAKRVKK